MTVHPSATSSLVRLPPGMHVFERGWLSSNNVLLTGPSGSTLIDSGYASHAPQTLALVRGVLGDGRLERIVTTHLHSDHCGGHALLQRVYGSHTCIPEGEANTVRHWRAEAFNFAETGQRCERFTFESTLKEGESIALGGLKWQVFDAPGHDPCAIMLYCAEERILISGDALWEDGFGVVFPELDGREGFNDVRRTLETIAKLAPRLVIPGHGAPFANAALALERAFGRLAYLEREPQRNARHALKVLLKFLLLDEQSLPLERLAERFGAIPLVRRINERFLGPLSDEALCEWLIADLVRVHAARIEAGCLVNATAGERFPPRPPPPRGPPSFPDPADSRHRDGPA